MDGRKPCGLSRVGERLHPKDTGERMSCLEADVFAMKAQLRGLDILRMTGSHGEI